MEAVDAVGQLLGKDSLHPFQVARVETEYPERLSVDLAGEKLGMSIEKLPTLLHDTVNDQRHLLSVRFGHGVP